MSTSIVAELVKDNPRRMKPSDAKARMYIGLTVDFGCRETKLLRAVIREDMSMSMVAELIKDNPR